MAALQAALAKFRSRAVVASNVKEAGRKEREEKIQQKAAAEAKQAGRSFTLTGVIQQHPLYVYGTAVRAQGQIE